MTAVVVARAGGDEDQDIAAEAEKTDFGCLARAELTELRVAPWPDVAESHKEGSGEEPSGAGSMETPTELTRIDGGRLGCLHSDGNQDDCEATVPQ